MTHYRQAKTIPLTPLTHAYSLSNKLTVFDSLQTTSLIFSSLQKQVGVLTQTRRQENCTTRLLTVIALNDIAELFLVNPKL